MRCRESFSGKLVALDKNHNKLPKKKVFLHILPVTHNPRSKNGPKKTNFLLRLTNNHSTSFRRILLLLRNKLFVIFRLINFYLYSIFTLSSKNRQLNYWKKTALELFADQSTTLKK